MNFKLVTYVPAYKPYFERFNKAWLEEYFTVEPIDTYVLENPEEAILKDGGEILFVEYKGDIIGTVALKKTETGVYELIKMAVDKKHQGIGAGKFICSAAIQKAKELSANKLILYSQTCLVPAIGTYKQLGFKEIPLEKGKYERANIKMEITFNSKHE